MVGTVIEAMIEPTNRRRIFNQELTTQQHRLLRGLAKAIERYGKPTLQQIADSEGSGRTAPSILRALNLLAEKGYVLRPQGWRLRLDMSGQPTVWAKRGHKEKS